MKQYPKNVRDVENLAKDIGWDDFTVQEDVVENGRNTTPHLIFGMDMNTKTVVSFCTLDLGGAVVFNKSPSPTPVVKVGNLLSRGTGNATAKGLLEYVEHVVKTDETLSRESNNIIADIEVTNTASRRAFETQGFKEIDVATVEQVTKKNKRVPWAAPTDEQCILVHKYISDDDDDDDSESDSDDSDNDDGDFKPGDKRDAGAGNGRAAKRTRR